MRSFFQRLCAMGIGGVQRLSQARRTPPKSTRRAPPNADSSNLALRQSEERFREIAELAPVIICEVDEVANRRFVNAQGVKTLGYDRDTLIEKFCSLEIYHPEDREGAAEVKKIIQQGRRPPPSERKLLHRDGSIVSVVSNAAPILRNGAVHGVRGCFTDVSAIKKLQEQIWNARRLEAIADLAGGVAHQFNNALAVIAGNLELMESLGPGKEELHDYITPIGHSCERLRQLTAHLLAYARGGQYKTESIDLRSLIETALPRLKSALKPFIQMETDLQPGLWRVNADAVQLQMVLTAIVTNSDEAIENEGRLRITLQNEMVPTTGPLVEEGLKPSRHVCLTVEDTGRGMDAETHQRLFTPFFSTKFFGRGLGLAAAYGIVRNHGGVILVDSTPGEGTRVRVYLPATVSETGSEEHQTAVL